jgi:hypothetical protein
MMDPFLINVRHALGLTPDPSNTAQHLNNKTLVKPRTNQGSNITINVYPLGTHQKQQKPILKMDPSFRLSDTETRMKLVCSWFNPNLIVQVLCSITRIRCYPKHMSYIFPVSICTAWTRLNTRSFIDRYHVTIVMITEIIIWIKPRTNQGSNIKINVYPLGTHQKQQKPILKMDPSFIRRIRVSSYDRLINSAV